MENIKRQNDRPQSSNEKTLNLNADWDNLKGKIRETYPSIDENDLQFMAKGEEEFIGRLQQKTGQTKHQIRRWANSMNKIM